MNETNENKNYGQEHRSGPKKLHRSKEDHMFAGVLAGIAHYLEVDPTTVRVIFVLLLVLTGFVPFGVLYLILWFLIPQAHGHEVISEEDKRHLEKNKKVFKMILIILLVTAFVMFLVGMVAAPFWFWQHPGYWYK